MKQKLVFIGNSIVNGFPLSRGRSFPGLVRAKVKAGETSFHADVINKGINGETTADILSRFDHDVIDHDPAAVFIMTGTNDFIYREAGPSLCMERLREMVRRAEAAGIRAVLMTPIHVHPEKASRMWMSGMGIDYGRINKEIDEFSDMIRQSGQPVVDTGEAWKDWAGEDAYLDGVHPVPEGYAFLAETVVSWIERHAEEIGLAQGTDIQKRH